MTLPAGDWTLVAFPNRAGWVSPVVPAAYPDTIPLSVGDPATALTGFALVLVVLVGLLVMIALVPRPRLRSKRDRPAAPAAHSSLD